MSIFKRFFGRRKENQARLEARARLDVERELFAPPSLAEVVRGDIHRDMERDRGHRWTQAGPRRRVPYYRATPEGLRKVREGHKYPRQLRDTTINFTVKFSLDTITCRGCRGPFTGVNYACEEAKLILCPRCFGRTKPPRQDRDLEVERMKLGRIRGLMEK